jgi:excinuclease ABC subunit B
MYADNMTASMTAAIAETDRRRTIQIAHNTANNIVPVGIIKGVRDLSDRLRKAAEEQGVYTTNDTTKRVEMPATREAMAKLIKDLEKQMKNASRDLEFEKAAGLRDQILDLRRTMALEEELAPAPAPARSRGNARRR